VTDLPYTDADLRTEAARQYADLTEDPDFVGVGAAMEDRYVPSVETTEDSSGRTWSDLLDPEGDGTKAYSEAQEKIHDLITGAANTSEWAVQLGAAGLKPHPAAAWKCVTTGWEVAVQVATARDLTDAATTELLTEIQTAVGEVVRRVLGLKPV
jgi:hypothetical protein